MDDHLAVFEQERPRLRAVAHRILGSWEQADDAVQETWLRLERLDPAEVANLPGWLTTVVSRLCLDALRARAARREELVEDPRPTLRLVESSVDPAALAEQADHVGEALRPSSVGRRPPPGSSPAGPGAGSAEGRPRPTAPASTRSCRPSSTRTATDGSPT